MLEAFRSTKTLEDVAKVLGYRPSSLSFILYKSNRETLYSEFEIPKKGGGKRKISAPNRALKGLQKRLANILSEIYDELHPRSPKRSVAHGFVRFLSIQTNASRHTHRRHVFNVDIESFFPSLNFGRVRGFFIGNKHFKMAPAAATIIAQIACYNNQLPQGSPCSPVIANLIAHSLDVSLARLARAAGVTYSRYADDLTFSTNQRNFSADIAHWDGKQWHASSKLVEVLRRNGFSLSEGKTRMSFRTGRQSVTGLVVNRHVNVRRSYYRVARAMTHSLLKTGTFVDPGLDLYPKDRGRRLLPRIRNWLSFHARYLLPLFDRVTHLRVFLLKLRRPSVRKGASTLVSAPQQDPAEPSLDVLHGMLSFIYHVKVTTGRDTRPNKAIRALFKSFLIYKYFYAPARPMLLFEGKTDYIYIRAAMRGLATQFPNLVSVTGQKASYSVSFFPRRSKTADVLDMTADGEGVLKTLIAKYASYMSGIEAPGQQNPVIVVIDNDTGGESIYKMLRGQGIEITMQTGPGIQHISHNLYLLATDPMGPTGKSCIEQLFTQATRDIKLEGRSFKFEGETVKELHYGKAEFASRVVSNTQNAIDFSGFVPLLTRISDVVTGHKNKVDASPATPPSAPAAVVESA